MVCVKPTISQNDTQNEQSILPETFAVVPGPEDFIFNPIPNYWDFKILHDPPSTEDLGTVRFLMSDDFPPFTSRTPENRLAGFHVDLARALCAELGISCIVMIHPFDKLEGTLANGNGDAIMAGLSISKGLKSGFAFSDIYLTTPARFVMRRRGRSELWPSPTTLAGRSVGVVEGSSHSAFIKEFFPKAKQTVFESRFAARREILNGKIDFLFDDGLSLSFWLNGEKSRNCCQFIGGPYTESLFFGEGFAIAFAKSKPQLKRGFDYALQELAKNGIFAELYLRYFPIGFFGSE